MCGRYASTARRTDLREQFQVDDDRADMLKEPDYNVAPTKLAPIVIARPPADGAKDPDAVRQLRLFKWGLVPFWAKDVKIGNRLVNARSETVHDKPAFRAAFKSRRCLIPVDAFYEWFETDQISDKTKKPLKQPFALPVNCTMYSSPGVPFPGEGTWCGVRSASAAGGEEIRSGQTRAGRPSGAGPTARPERLMNPQRHSPVTAEDRWSDNRRGTAR
ncbi:SOS response-associated peptidase [Kribbella pittospori]|uniref:Abasic site processing protein n=1 Tax=Kribbella pittospori TaxID=722689 RepID=A0A4V2M766_9ACTN|nr:SOS response-associated peptidase [Kribbella pittospori]TCC46322.1 SOS response-associated peptidase [Kribbella pittospori]